MDVCCGNQLGGDGADIGLARRQTANRVAIPVVGGDLRNFRQRNLRPGGTDATSLALAERRESRW
jgi:hypothetical protein